MAGGTTTASHIITATMELAIRTQVGQATVEAVEADAVEVEAGMDAEESMKSKKKTAELAETMNTTTTALPT